MPIRVQVDHFFHGAPPSEYNQLRADIAAREVDDLKTKVAENKSLIVAFVAAVMAKLDAQTSAIQELKDNPDIPDDTLVDLQANNDAIRAATEALAAGNPPPTEPPTPPGETPVP